jgi:hypothetical protein
MLSGFLTVSDGITYPIKNEMDRSRRGAQLEPSIPSGFPTVGVRSIGAIINSPVVDSFSVDSLWHAL